MPTFQGNPSNSYRDVIVRSGLTNQMTVHRHSQKKMLKGTCVQTNFACISYRYYNKWSKTDTEHSVLRRRLFISKPTDGIQTDMSIWEVGAELVLSIILASYILLEHQYKHVSVCADLGFKSQQFLSDCLPFLVPIYTLSATIKRLAAMCVFPPALKEDPVAPIFLINYSYKWCHLASADH